MLLVSSPQGLVHQVMVSHYEHPEVREEAPQRPMQSRVCSIEGLLHAAIDANVGVESVKHQELLLDTLAGVRHHPIAC